MSNLLPIVVSSRVPVWEVRSRLRSYHTAPSSLSGNHTPHHLLRLDVRILDRRLQAGLWRIYIQLDPGQASERYVHCVCECNTS